MSRAPEPLPPAARTAMTDAARWRLASVLLERPRPGWHGLVRALAAEIADERLAQAAREAQGFAESAYLRLLGPGGGSSPREVAYRPMADFGRLMAELRGAYRAFGYRPRTEDPPDHLAVVAGFVGWLSLKEAYALARGDDEHAETTRAATRLVADEHLAGFADRLAAALDGSGAAHLARAAEWIVDAAGIRPAEDPLRVLPDGVPFPGADDGPYGGCGAE